MKAETTPAPAHDAEAAAQAPAAVEHKPAAPPEAPEAARPAPAARQPDLPAITEADPDKPKRSGWWARAKANLTGH